MRLRLRAAESGVPKPRSVRQLLDAHRARHRGKPEARPTLTTASTSAAVVVHGGTRQLRARQGCAGELDRA